MRRALLLLVLASGAAVAGGVEDTRHNLSASGPGEIRSADEDEICVFCHVPHSTAGEAPRWSPNAASPFYEPYQSPTMTAASGQPDGVSRQCLSCHDGTIASSAARSGPAPFDPPRVGVRRLTGGRKSDIASRLSGSHPVSVVQQEAVGKRAMAGLTGLHSDPALLDASGKVQCTSCHDPHEDPAANGLDTPPFWRGASFSEVCNTCHDAPLTDLGHEDPTLLPLGCGSCHVGHGVARQPMLPAPEEEACFVCHGSPLEKAVSVAEGRLGAVAKPARIDDMIDAPYRHPVDRTFGVHVSDEDVRSASTQRHVECLDCHAIHGSPARVARKATTATLFGSDGRPAYEVCYGCHGDSPSRPLGQSDKSAELAMTNRSYHPVEIPARDGSPSLLAPWRAGDLMGCGDCHASATDTDPRGPHGSRNRWLLRGEYSVEDGATESPRLYQACYRCHDRGVILSDSTFAGHSSHVAGAEISCWSCHDSHGSVEGPGLVRFGKDSRYGIVAPSSSGRLEYAPEEGGCFLTCHGVDHNPLGYR